MNYRILHTTAYTYAEPVTLCHNIARLVPRNTDIQKCSDYNITIFPRPDIMNEYEDFFGNKVLYFAIQEEHQKLTVTVTSHLNKTTKLPHTSEMYANVPWEKVAALLQEPTYENFDARQYTAQTAMTVWNNDVIAYVRQSFWPGRSVCEASFDLMHRIYTDFEFKSGLTTIATPVAEIMAKKKGVCQDFAHFAIACLRSIGLPARYMSGYIETIPAPGKEKLVGVDASHAWFAIYVPNVGWLEFDPTNNKVPSTQHLVIGWGRDYADITPLKGIILSSGNHKLDVSVDVRKL